MKIGVIKRVMDALIHNPILIARHSQSYHVYHLLQVKSKGFCEKTKNKDGDGRR